MALTLSKSSTVPTRGESALVAATRAGDDRAFAELYARYRERILAFIVSRVHDHGRAEDIMQEVFIAALRRLRASDQAIAFKPWIYEIAKNACIDEFRRGTRSHEVPMQEDGELPGDRQTTLAAVPPPPAVVEGRQRMEDLRGAFGGLSDTHHQLLVMREFEGLSYDEIGGRLHMTRQMVESSLFRARRKLTVEYEELASGRRCEQVQFAIQTGAMASARSLGLRERRVFARHLAHCQICRHNALEAGVDQTLVKPRSVAAKIAALLPFPLWRWSSLLRRGGSARSGLRAGSPRLLSSGALHNVAGLAEPAAGPAVGLAPAAVAAAALALAGFGGGLLHAASGTGQPRHPLTATRAAALIRGPGSSSTATSGSFAAAGPARAAQIRHAAITLSGTAAGRVSPAGAAAARQGAGHRSHASGAGTGPLSAAGTVPSALRPLGGVVPPRPVRVGKVPGSAGSAISNTTQHVVSTGDKLAGSVGDAASRVGSAVASQPLNTLQSLFTTVQDVAADSAPAAPATSPPSSSGATGAPPTVAGVLGSPASPPAP